MCLSNYSTQSQSVQCMLSCLNFDINTYTSCVDKFFFLKKRSELTFTDRKMSSSESEAENPPEDITEERQQQEKSFEDLGLDDALRERCEALGWKKPTKIQVEAIPVALEVSRVSTY